jgi:hypothetical protein
MFSCLRLATAAVAALALTGCVTLKTPARNADDAAAQAWQGKRKNGYLGLTMNFQTAGVTGESCLVLSLQNQVDKEVVDTRVCDRDFEPVGGKRGGAVVFAIPAGRYAVKAATLRLPGNFNGTGHRVESQLESQSRLIEVEPHGFVHFASVDVEVATKDSMRNTWTSFGEKVSYGRPDDATWQEFAGLLRTLPSRYMATNGEQRPLSWSFVAE